MSHAGSPVNMCCRVADRISTLPVIAVAVWIIFTGCLLVAGGAAAASTVKISADQKVHYDLENKVFVAEGDVRITQDNTVIRCKRAEITTDKKIAKISGSVELKEPDVLLTADQLVVYFNEKRVVALGNVVLVKDEEVAGGASEADTGPGTAQGGTKGGGGMEVKVSRQGKAPQGEAQKRTEKVTLKADRLEYWTNKKECVAEGHVFVQRKDTKAWGDKATYSEKEKLLVLAGSVRAESPEGERLTSKELRVWTDRDLVEAGGGVDIEFEVEEEGKGTQGK